MCKRKHQSLLITAALLLATPAFAAPPAPQIIGLGQPITAAVFRGFARLSPAQLRDAREHAARTARRDTAQYTTIDAPGEGLGQGQGTWAWAISNSSAITGWYVDAKNAYHGFLRAPDGTYTTIDVGSGGETVAYAVNDKGAVGGSYVDRKTNRCPGYLRTPKGKAKKFDPPNDGSLWAQYCAFDGPLNNHGTLVGGYPDSSDVLHSFFRLKDGTLREFDPPDATEGSSAYGINDGGAIAGEYFDSSGYHGYIRATDGTFTEFDPPNSVAIMFAGPINAQGDVEGDYQDTNQVFHGYIREPDGTFVVYDAPDAGKIAGLGTGGQAGINKDGTTAGVYWDAAGYPHGYTRASDGTFTEFDVPGSIATYPSGLNDNGEVAGYYIDPFGTFHGFLRTP